MSSFSYLQCLWDGRRGSSDSMLDLLWGVLSRIRSRECSAFLCSSYLAFPLSVFVSIHVVHPYNSMDTATTWKKSCLISSGWRNHYATSQILTIYWIIKWSCAKNLEVTRLVVNFTKAFNSLRRGKMEQIRQE